MVIRPYCLLANLTSWALYELFVFAMYFAPRNKIPRKYPLTLTNRGIYSVSSSECTCGHCYYSLFPHGRSIMIGDVYTPAKRRKNYLILSLITRKISHVKIAANTLTNSCERTLFHWKMSKQSLTVEYGCGLREISLMCD